eukprot:39170-Chlamydomonas_euryale.AAC.15
MFTRAVSPPPAPSPVHGAQVAYIPPHRSVDSNCGGLRACGRRRIVSWTCIEERMWSSKVWSNKVWSSKVLGTEVRSPSTNAASMESSGLTLEKEWQRVRGQACVLWCGAVAWQGS